MSGRQLDDLFLPAQRFCKTFGKPFPISAKMTDVPGHTCAIIEPLVRHGVKFLHLGKNPYSLAPDVPLLFWWEDLKGNRVLTMYTQFYGSQTRPPRGWKYPVWLALNQTGDNEGGHSAAVIEEMRSACRRTGNSGPVRWTILPASCSDATSPICRWCAESSEIHGYTAGEHIPA